MSTYSVLSYNGIYSFIIYFSFIMYTDNIAFMYLYTIQLCASHWACIQFMHAKLRNMSRIRNRHICVTSKISFCNSRILLWGSSALRAHAKGP